MHDIMSVICTNIAVRVVVVKVAAYRSRRVATAVLRVCVAALICCGSKNIVDLFARTLCSLRLRRCPCRRFCMQEHVYPSSCVSLPPIVRGSSEKMPPRQASPAGCNEKIVAAFIRIRPLSWQVFPVLRNGNNAVAFSCIRPLPWQVFRRGARGKSLRH